MSTNNELIDHGSYYEIVDCEVKPVVCDDGVVGYTYCPYIPKILDQKEDTPCHT